MSRKTRSVPISMTPEDERKLDALMEFFALKNRSRVVQILIVGSYRANCPAFIPHDHTKTG